MALCLMLAAAGLVAPSAQPRGAARKAQGVAPPLVLPAPPVEIQSARLEPVRPVAGRPASLVVRARARSFPVNALRVDFGEPGRRFGTSACRLGAAPPGSQFSGGVTVTIRISVIFRLAGPHDVRFTVTAGGCAGAAVSLAGHVPIDIAPATAASHSAADGCSGADVVPSGGNLGVVRSATLCLINLERARRRLAALRTNGKLDRAASAHARDMVARRFFDHQGPHGPTFEQRLRRARFSGSAGEDIAYQTAAPDATARTIVADWMNSPPHRANILRGPFRLAGVGVVASTPLDPPEGGSTFTVDFGRGR
jgi:uncharacterized protein YkwD